jgi:hypothetical protein
MIASAKRKSEAMMFAFLLEDDTIEVSAESE